MSGKALVLFCVRHVCSQITAEDVLVCFPLYLQCVSFGVVVAVLEI